MAKKKSITFDFKKKAQTKLKSMKKVYYRHLKKKKTKLRPKKGILPSIKKNT